jgi:hypothetical protein
LPHRDLPWGCSGEKRVSGVPFETARTYQTRVRSLQWNPVRRFPIMLYKKSVCRNPLGCSGPGFVTFRGIFGGSDTHCQTGETRVMPPSLRTDSLTKLGRVPHLAQAEDETHHRDPAHKNYAEGGSLSMILGFSVTSVAPHPPASSGASDQPATNGFLARMDLTRSRRIPFPFP